MEIACRIPNIRALRTPADHNGLDQSHMVLPSHLPMGAGPHFSSTWSPQFVLELLCVLVSSSAALPDGPLWLTLQTCLQPSLWPQFILLLSWLPGWTPALVYGLPCLGLSKDPVTSPSLCLPCSGPSGVHRVNEGMACARVTLSSWLPFSSSWFFWNFKFLLWLKTLNFIWDIFCLFLRFSSQIVQPRKPISPQLLKTDVLTVESVSSRWPSLLQSYPGGHFQ